MTNNRNITHRSTAYVDQLCRGRRGGAGMTESKLRRLVEIELEGYIYTPSGWTSILTTRKIVIDADTPDSEILRRVYAAGKRGASGSLHYGDFGATAIRGINPLWI